MAFFVFNGFGWGEGSFNYRVPFIRAYINLIGADGTAFGSDKVSFRAFDNPFGADRIQIRAYRDPFRADKIPIGAYSSFFRAEENDPLLYANTSQYYFLFGYKYTLNLHWRMW